VEQKPHNEEQRPLRPLVRARDTGNRPNAKGSGGKRQQQGQPSRLTWLIPVGIIALLVLLYFVWPSYQNLVDQTYQMVRRGDREALQNWVSGCGVWGVLLVYALMIAQTLLAFIPSLLVTLVPVLAYGSFWGGVVAWSGLLLAAWVAYGIGRMLGTVTVERFIGHETEQRVEEFVSRYGVWGVIAARVSPALSTDAVSFVAGLIKMGFWRFSFATALGTLPLVALIAFLGRDVERLRGGLIWVSVISLGLFVAYVLWDRRRARSAEGA
jgi:uncharacterized membrane protein YdjX (TVP38/TMEM64 family)